MTQHVETLADALPLDAFANATKIARAFGCTAAQAATAFTEFGKAAKRLDDEGKTLRAALDEQREAPHEPTHF